MEHDTENTGTSFMYLSQFGKVFQFHIFLCNFYCMFLRKIFNQNIFCAPKNLLLESLGKGKYCPAAPVEYVTLKRPPPEL